VLHVQNDRALSEYDSGWTILANTTTAATIGLHSTSAQLGTPRSAPLVPFLTVTRGRSTFYSSNLFTCFSRCALTACSSPNRTPLALCLVRNVLRET
jgi:hypothetical protein